LGVLLTDCNPLKLRNGVVRDGVHMKYCEEWFMDWNTFEIIWHSILSRNRPEPTSCQLQLILEQLQLRCHRNCLQHSHAHPWKSFLRWLLWQQEFKVALQPRVFLLTPKIFLRRVDETSWRYEYEATVWCLKTRWSGIWTGKHLVLCKLFSSQALFKVRHPAIESRRSRFSEIRVLWSRYYTEKKLCQA